MTESNRNCGPSAGAQRLIAHVVEDVLKLPVREQVVDEPGNIALLRSTLLRCSQLADPKALPF